MVIPTLDEGEGFAVTNVARSATKALREYVWPKALRLLAKARMLAAN